MTGGLVLFALAAGLAIAFALAMIVETSPVRSVLSLVVTFFGITVLAILLAAPFIAAIIMIVYAGAILVLFLFVIMLLNLNEEAREKDARPVQRVLGLVAVLALGGLLLGLTLRAGAPPVAPSAAAAKIPSPDEIPLIGRLLFSDYLFAFEAVAVLLLAAAVGALILSKRRMD
ncbi:MAG TPA: NADH-quinone oxidoreductase subunit J [Thermoanaerobaculia bacterium]|jgi:NADH-quinone oxidoreductase subunit J|nr:NADH-quinone oxidoreductase subunit J [Thermoanaerobaculia bacterium]